ncbi:hypothetical protein SVAN01_09271 [Stagonosporopsis vannaccii]|nr:hypothetical protein SVAN01_09271 [Stagonosporopsis vannaccii]
MNWFASIQGLEPLCSLCKRADAFCVSTYLCQIEMRVASCSILAEVIQSHNPVSGRCIARRP